jgi:adhesin HecA-like repeat protein
VQVTAGALDNTQGVVQAGQWLRLDSAGLTNVDGSVLGAYKVAVLRCAHQYLFCLPGGPYST